MVSLNPAQMGFYFSSSVPGCTASMASDHYRLLCSAGSGHLSDHNHALYSDCMQGSKKDHRMLLLLSLPVRFVVDWHQMPPSPHIRYRKRWPASPDLFFHQLYPQRQI